MFSGSVLDGEANMNLDSNCKTLRQRLLEMCKATADFAIFSRFGWHRRGDPLKSKKNCFVQSCYFWEGKFFCLYTYSVQNFEFVRVF